MRTLPARRRNAQRWLILAGSVSTLVLTALLALAAAPASAGLTHLRLEQFGSAAKPGFSGADGLAVDQSTGGLLVIDGSSAVVSRFKSDGEPDPFPALGTNVIDGKNGPEGKPCAEEPASCDMTPQNNLTFGGASGEQQVAVDNSGTVTDGNIYVTQSLASGGHLVNIFSSSGEYLGQLTGAGSGPSELKFGEGQSNGVNFGPCGVAVDSSGNVFVGGGFDDTIYKFDPSANPPVNADFVGGFGQVGGPCNLAAGEAATSGYVFADTTEDEGVAKVNSSTGALSYFIEPGTITTVAVDPETGHLYLSRFLGGSDIVLLEFDASGGTQPSALSTTSVFGLSGLAVLKGGSRLYLSYGGNSVDVYGPPVIVPDVTTGAAAIVSDTATTVQGTVNPSGEALTECFVEFGPTVAYGSTKPCESPNATEVGSGTTPVAVHADLSGLSEEALYHYRFVAKNTNGTVEGADKVFKTPSKPAISAQWVSGVDETAATLNVTLSPENAETTYRFEWGKDEPGPYEHVTAELPVGAVDEAEHSFSLPLSGLQLATAYRFRVVATNHRGTATGADRLFATTLAHPSGLLPDGRIFELVSSPDKKNAEVAVPGNVGGQHEFSVLPQQSSPDGEAMTYGSATSVGDAGGAALVSQYVSRRGPNGWSTENITPLFEEGYARDPIVGFTRSLSDAAAMTFNPPLAAGAAPNLWNLYRRDGTGAFTALTGVTPQTIPGAKSGEDFCPGFEGASEGFGRAIFIARNGALLPGNQLVAKRSNLYEWRAEPMNNLQSLTVKATGGSYRLTYEDALGSEEDTGAKGTGDLSAATGNGTLGSLATGNGTLGALATGTGDLLSGSKEITDVITSTGAFTVGESISTATVAAGIPNGTTITAVGAGTLTISQAATVTANNRTITSGSKEITGLATTTGAFAVGESISGTGIQEGTTITAATPTTLTISKGATATGAKSLLSGSREITGLTTSTGEFAVGQEITATGIQTGTTITAVTPTTLTLSEGVTQTGAKALTAGSREITNLSTETGTFLVGEILAGTGIPAGTTIVKVEPGKLTISNRATAKSTAAAIAADLPATGPAALLEEALEALPILSAGGGSVTVSGGPGDGVGTSPYLVAFDGGPLAQTHQEPLEADSAGLSGGVHEASVNVLADGHLALASVLPSGVAATPASGTSFGASFSPGGSNVCNMEPAPVRHAISRDGRRAFWTDKGSASEPLFARVIKDETTETYQLDASQGGAEAGKGRYLDATPDGRYVFFTSSSKLTPAPANAGDLYRYDVQRREAGEPNPLQNLTAQAGEAADVQGLLGTSEDGSYAYFVAKGVLTATPNSEGDSAVAGQPNLYAWHEGEAEPAFVATLGAAGFGDSSGDTGSWSTNPSKQTARVSPDGRHVAFLSLRSLTGFDNELPGGAECQGLSTLCTEVFLYDLEAERLTCASCDPSGEQPIGTSTLPTWRTPYEQPRYLQDGGRLFFESKDPLDPNDSNGLRDVYEYEPAGFGSCTTSEPTYHAAKQGCLYLISTGTSTDRSFFLDASEDGRDVFISTREALVPQLDKNTTYDVYDARIGGTPYQPPAPECEGEGCREAGTAAPPASQPGTLSFEGPGDQRQTRCKKGFVKKRGKCVKKKPAKKKQQKRASAKRGAGR